MLMKAKERWHCVSVGCGCQVIVEIGGEIHGQNPRCACGGIMRKKYASPVFAYLDFLRIDEPSTGLTFDGGAVAERMLTPAELAMALPDEKPCAAHR
jgi:hypothetical protein